MSVARDVTVALAGLALGVMIDDSTDICAQYRCDGMSVWNWN
jgi:hypothetical protein